MRRRAGALHLGAIAVLTMLSQLGGLAWAGAMLVSRRKGLRMQGFLLAFGLFYGLIWGAAQVTAPAFGRVPLPCSGAPLRMQSPLYCALMRNFVTPELRDVALDAAHAVAAEHPGTITLALDGSLPFLDGLPLFPHLSHDDGEKLDFAFFYADATGYAPGQTASPLGYFAFERAGAEQCPPPSRPCAGTWAGFSPCPQGSDAGARPHGHPDPGADARPPGCEDLCRAAAGCRPWPLG